MGVSNTLLNRIKRDPSIKKPLYKMLKYPIFTQFPLYSYLYMANVKHKIGNLESKPTFVTIENTNFCNSSCIFCPNQRMQRKKGIIERTLFEDIVNQCAKENLQNLLIQGFGEPMMDNDYVSKVRFAKIKGIAKVGCVTNGILLNQQIANELVKSGLDYLCVSIDAASREVYKKIHRTPRGNQPLDMFDVVVKNIEGLVQAKRSQSKDSPWVQVRFKDFEENRGELKDFIRRFEGLVDDIFVYMNILNWPGSDIKNNLPKDVRILKFPCHYIWTTLYISQDGRVPICCQDYECQVEIGNVNNQSLLEIWNSDTLRNIRRYHLNKQFDKIPVCKDCIVNSQFVTPWWP